MTRRALAALILVAGLAPVSAAQSRPVLTATLSRAVEAISAKATADGLPIEPIRNKALEGVSKGATEAEIEEALEALRHRLLRGRRALGSRSTSAELIAAAAALDMGMPEGDLERLRIAAPHGELTGALMGGLFLLQRGASNQDAIAAVFELLRGGASDADIARFQTSVMEDVRAGARIGAAARVRATALTAARVPRR